MAYGYKDQNGNAWSIDGTGDNWKAKIVAPAFGVPGGRQLVTASSKQEAEDAIANLVDIWNETGKLTEMGGSLQVTATPPKGGGFGAVVVLVAVLYILSKKGR